MLSIVNPAVQIPPRPHPGFTLLEVLVVAAVLGLLVALLLPAAAGAQARSTAVSCLGNLRQLQLAWQLYTDDYHGHLPSNQAVLLDEVWRSTPDSWIGFSNAARDTSLAPIEQGLFHRLDYNRTPGLYRCPADKAPVRNRTGGMLRQKRTRSYALNGNLAGRPAETQVTVQRLDAIPEPARLFTFLDEAEESIDDGHFLVWPAPDFRWVNLPAGRHDRTGVLSFADGHAERWHWQAPKRFLPLGNYWQPAASPADLRDLRKLQAHSLPLRDLTSLP